MRWIPEENYDAIMAEEVEPWLAERRETGFDERVKGQPIYYEHYRAENPKAVIVISHGFTETIRKFRECIYYMLQAGYEVWGLDHRGHGQSFRLNDNPCVVHAARFEDYVDDLRHLTETRVRPAAGTLPLYLYCHSMGGCIGARVLESAPELFQKAVLSAPMMGVNLGKIPEPVALAMLRVKGAGAKAREPLSPVAGFTETEKDFEASAASSFCRYRYNLRVKQAERQYQTCAASMGWIREALQACNRVCSRRETAKIRVPVLLLQAGRDTFVKNSAQDLFASRVPSCELRRYPALKHELYMSDRSDLVPYWEGIFQFLG
jgi:lysophospholipase